MNANDYAREWYSCSEVNGDFSLKYFILRQQTAREVKAMKEDEAKAAQKAARNAMYGLPGAFASWRRMGGNRKSNPESPERFPDGDYLFLSERL